MRMRATGAGACSTRCARSYLKIARTERMIYDTFDNDPSGKQARSVGARPRVRDEAQEEV